MPFISGFSPEGRTLGESERQSTIDEKEARRISWKSSEEYTAFNAANFVRKINADLQQKKKEYDAIRAGFFGSVRAVFTRYQEKDEFLNKEVAPLLMKCQDSLSAANKQELVRKLEAGVERFTTFKKQSGIAKILEAALFALTDEQLTHTETFSLDGLDKDKRLVVASVVHEAPPSEAVVGTAVALTEGDRLLSLLSHVRVPCTPIGLFNPSQSALPVAKKLEVTSATTVLA